MRQFKTQLLDSTRPLPRSAESVPHHSILGQLLDSSVLLTEEWESLPKEERHALLSHDPESVLEGLVERGLLTEYQRGRIEAGTTFGLVLGNYRVLDRLGAGGMGVVFRAEHTRMRRLVAIKVLPLGPERDQRILRRFMTEIRAIAKLQHPNIVAAFDAGELSSPDGGMSVLHYFVMEYVPGQDLEQYVVMNGPMSPAQACDIMHQVASALGEANKHNLVHRDIKPSNIQITPEGQAKLLDFGLARNYKASVTEPGTLLGTVDYMAPEQVRDAHSVDIRADLYALGGVLYWCLTGKTPFPSNGNAVRDLARRLEQPPPSVRDKRPELPEELDRVIQRLMALNPEDRYPNPEATMRALLPLLKPELRDHFLTAPRFDAVETATIDVTVEQPLRKQHRILLVDDDDSMRNFCKYVLEAEGLDCDDVDCGRSALEATHQSNYDLLIVDINMPDMLGTEVCKKLREDPPGPNLKIILASGNANADIMAQMMMTGADDFITKPFSVAQLQARVKAALRLKDAQDRSDMLNRHLLTVNSQLEDSLDSRASDLVHARNALVLALAKLVERRSNEHGTHPVRMQHFARCLAEEARRCESLSMQIDHNFIELLGCCAPLHDLGMIGLPDHILLKPGKLDSDERVIMQAHTHMGAETLEQLLESHGSAVAFLQMAIDIARHHHERYDGSGYPDGLAGNEIPLSARIVAICDVYDALRSRRVYKPALSHMAAQQVMKDAAGTQFDPALLLAFERCAVKFDRIFKEIGD